MFISSNIESCYEKDFERLGELLDTSNFLVTGATGVVGEHILYVLSALVRRGVKISGDLLSLSGSTPQCGNLTDFVSFPVNCGDQRSLSDFKEGRSKYKYTHVIHAAGYGQPNRFMADPLSVISLNSTGTSALARIAMESDARFLFLSSSEIYSGCPSKPSELAVGVTTPQHLRAPYVEAKRLGETICEVFRNDGLHATSARLALAYGPGAKLDDGRVLNQFIIRALQQKHLRLMDAGTAIRSYIFGVDAAIGLMNILTSGRESVYNIGGSSSVSIFELANQIGALAGVDVSIPETSESAVYDHSAPQDVSLNTDRYSAEFGLLERTNLREGLQETINWYRTKLSSKEF